MNDMPIDDVPKLTTGQDATLGNYRKLAIAAFGINSAAVKYLDAKILGAPHGENEPVLADERQTLHVLNTLALGDGSKEKKEAKL